MRSLNYKEIYSRVHGAAIRNDMDDALDSLEDIIRRLNLMESGEEIPESSLLVESQHESLCLMRSVAYSVSYEAHYVLERIGKDFDTESLLQENQRFRKIYSNLEKLSESEDGKFMEYCRDKFLEYTLARKARKDTTKEDTDKKPYII